MPIGVVQRFSETRMPYSVTRTLLYADDTLIVESDGSVVKEKEAMVYLGSLLAADGQSTAELSRRLGMGMADYEAAYEYRSAEESGHIQSVRVAEAPVLLGDDLAHSRLRT